MRTLLYKLAHRLVGQSPTPSYKNADRFYLHLYILRELKLLDEARTLLDSEVGRNICSTSLSCDEIRRDISRSQGLWKEEGERAESRILADKSDSNFLVFCSFQKLFYHRDRNWLEFVSVLDAVFAPPVSREAATQIVDEQKLECSRRMEEAQKLFQQVAESDDGKDRSGLLALLELEKRARTNGFSSGLTAILPLISGDSYASFQILLGCSV
jgi:N-terminal acetyltransferase B complex non-catalytic subunit